MFSYFHNENMTFLTNRLFIALHYCSLSELYFLLKELKKFIFLFFLFLKLLKIAILKSLILFS